MKKFYRRNFLKKGTAALVGGGALLRPLEPGVMAGSKPPPLGQGGQALTGAQGSLRVTIHTQQTAPPVSKYVLGMFIEHIGPLIYRSLWSELLDDRKFYFPISSKKPAAPARRQGGGPGREALRPWRPVGPDEIVVDGQRAAVCWRPEPAH
jgi:hypothetical protein